MFDATQSKSLNTLFALLGQEEYPKADLNTTELRPTDTVIGKLTAGEASLIRFVEQERRELAMLTQGVPISELDSELKQRAATASFGHDLFMHLVSERLGDAMPKTAIVCRTFELVNRVIHDCGCGRGMRCGMVMAGLIDPDTGEMSSGTEGMGGLASLLLGGGLLGARMRRRPSARPDPDEL